MSNAALQLARTDATPFDNPPILGELTFSIAAYAKEKQTEALLKASEIKTISTPEEMEAANPVLRQIKLCLKLMEDSRKEVKAPILKMGKDIETAAQAYADPLKEEELRLKKLVADFFESEQKASIEHVKLTGEPLAISGGAGISTTEEWKFEVINESLAYKCSPHFFDLVPKKAVIIEQAKLGIHVPGVRVWKETGVRVKA